MIFFYMDLFLNIYIDPSGPGCGCSTKPLVDREHSKRSRISVSSAQPGFVEQPFGARSNWSELPFVAGKPLSGYLLEELKNVILCIRYWIIQMHYTKCPFVLLTFLMTKAECPYVYEIKDLTEVM